MPNLVCSVVALTGTAVSKGPNGIVRTLNLFDEIRSGERISCTGNGGAFVVLRGTKCLREVTVKGLDEITVDSDVFPDLDYAGQIDSAIYPDAQTVDRIAQTYGVGISGLPLPGAIAVLLAHHE